MNDRRLAVHRRQASPALDGTATAGPRRAGLRWLLAALACVSPAVLAQVDVRIAAVDPEGSSSLIQGDPLSVRLTYQSDVPLRFSVAGYANGSPGPAARTNPAPVYPAGAGEAIVWLEPYEPGYLDEVRVKVHDEGWQELDVLSQPVSLYWERGSRAATRPAPEWVARLSAEQQGMVRQAVRAQTSAGGDGGSFLVLLMGWSIPAYVVLQVYMLSRFSGGWRKAALVPLVLMIPLGLYTIFALLAGSNLWPLMLLFLTPLAFLYLAVLGLVRLAGRPAAHD